MQVLKHMPQLCCNPLRKTSLQLGPGQVGQLVSLVALVLASNSRCQEMHHFKMEMEL